MVMCVSQRFIQLTLGVVVFCCALSMGGCARFRKPSMSQGPRPPLENPLFVPALDREFLWNQTVDVVDDFFRIEREERIRLIGGVLTEGRIDTFPKVGSTVFEPWKEDSTWGSERWLATFQSIRRRAIVRVIPTSGGYLIDVVVNKELEDLDKPENATAGGSTLRHDGTLNRREGTAGRYSTTLGWINKGRDESLEQLILERISQRLSILTSVERLPAGDVDSGSGATQGQPFERTAPIETIDRPPPLQKPSTRMPRNTEEPAPESEPEELPAPGRVLP